MNAIDVRYNLQVVSGKEIVYNGSAENMKEEMSYHGCPNSLNKDFFPWSQCSTNDQNCNRCWKQEPKGSKEYDKEYNSR